MFDILLCLSTAGVRLACTASSRREGGIRLGVGLLHAGSRSRSRSRLLLLCLLLLLLLLDVGLLLIDLGRCADGNLAGNGLQAQHEHAGGRAVELSASCRVLALETHELVRVVEREVELGALPVERSQLLRQLLGERVHDRRNGRQHANRRHCQVVGIVILVIVLDLLTLLVHGRGEDTERLADVHIHASLVAEVIQVVLCVVAVVRSVILEKLLHNGLHEVGLDGLLEIRDGNRCGHFINTFKARRLKGLKVL